MTEPLSGTPSDPYPALSQALSGATELCFLCSGNMVRSAFAELYARHCQIALPVRSAATRFRNDELLPETRRALARRGVPDAWLDSFRPTHLEDVRREFSATTVFFGMRTEHLIALSAFPRLAERGFLLPQVSGEPLEVPDPVLEGADFGATFANLARYIEDLVGRLAQRTPRGEP